VRATGCPPEVIDTVRIPRFPLLFVLLSTPLLAAPPPSSRDEVDTCLSCHEDKTASMTLASGETVSLFVDRAVFEKSVHGEKLGCTACHPGSGEVPHADLTVKDKASLSALHREACRSCHADTYKKALDGMHEKVRAKGDTVAPTCVDCHGSHDVARPNAPRARIAKTCETCHSAVYATYARSVHGRALARDNPDVPACTDCHRAHDIQNPHAATWRLASYETCGKCHSDKQRMARYGISADVLKTYLSDFHGSSASLSKAGRERQEPVVAVCIDCHGTHDIKRTKNAGSQVFQANLTRTCQKCHANTTANFQATWLSHYVPSPKRAPLVWLVGVFYKIFIPFLIGGLVLQVLLHLWRFMVNR
jgi:predicted CXXCH cytochrome family protein